MTKPKETNLERLQSLIRYLRGRGQFEAAQDVEDALLEICEYRYPAPRKVADDVSYMDPRRAYQPNDPNAGRGF
jgi:hypothetical protein